jgi:prepilin-type processing-associated H-X9-DG protein/prepilin-type N-terminal cleavage/methylation domain-containing protein
MDHFVFEESLMSKSLVYSRASTRRLSVHKQAIGFTLVELLVVIGIISLLISILLPALGKARAAAATLKCEANLRSISQGLAMYLLQYHGVYPQADGSSDNDNGQNKESFRTWGAHLAVCMYPGGNFPVEDTGPTPHYHFDDADSYSVVTNQRMNGVFRCPSAALDATDLPWVPNTTYAVNPVVFANGCPKDNWNWGGSRNLPRGPWTSAAMTRGSVPYYKAGWMKNNAEKAIVMDSNIRVVQNGQGIGGSWGACWDIDFPDITNEGARAGYQLAENSELWSPGTPANILGTPVDLTSSDRDQGVPYWRYYPRFRHGNNNQGNFLFADGHVETFTRHRVGTSYVSGLLRKNIAVYWPSSVLGL